MALLVAAWLTVLAAPAPAQQPDAAASPAATPNALSAANIEDLGGLLGTLRDPAALEAFTRQLETLIALRQGAPEEHGDSGTKALEYLSNQLSGVGADLGALEIDFGRLGNWAGEQFNDPDRRSFWLGVLLDLVIVFGAGLVLRGLARQVLRPARRRIEERAAPTLWVRAPLLLVRTAIDLLPVGIFAAAVFGALALVDPHEDTRLVALAVANAVVIARVLVAVVRALLTPLAPSLRLSSIPDRTAAYIFVWGRRLVNISVYGYLVAQVAFLLGLPEVGFAILTKLVGLVVTALLFSLVLQNHQAVRAWIQGLGGERDGRYVTLDLVRDRFAEVWHILAGLYLAAVYLIWALEVTGGFAFVAQATAMTVVIVVGARLLVEGVRRGTQRVFRVSQEIRARFPAIESRSNRYLWVVRRTLATLIYLAAALAILQSWSLDVFSFFGTNFGQQVLGRGFNIVVIGLASLLIWEGAALLIDRLLQARDSEGDAVVKSARLRTLLPLARSVTLLVILTVATLAVLAELGVNIAPLLAGAGVVGLAVGFGAQTLVKDVITGAFILFEDSIAVGDYVEVGSHSGTVEAITVRTIRLRDIHGTVHTIPFSSVDSVKNYTKDFAYHVAEIGVAYRENTDDVVKLLREIGEDLRADPEYADDIIEPMEINGLDRFDDSAVVIRSRLKTRAGAQWRVKREFNRRVKLKFDEEGIEIPFPHTTIYFGEDREGNAPPAHVRIGQPSESKT